MNQQNNGTKRVPYINTTGVTNRNNSLPNKRLLLNSLRKGGYILYARHAEATVGEDQPNLDFNDCSTQRNLSNNGITQAVAYGVAIRNLQIPIQPPVLSSPFCRNIETAVLAFGGPNVQIDPFWIQINNLSVDLSPEEQKRILDTLMLNLEVQPPVGRNRVIISHGFPSEVGLGQIPYMGTVVVKPRGHGNGYEVIARLSFSELIGMVGQNN